MEKDWVKIFTTNQTFRAEIVKGMLGENGVTAVLVNRVDSSYLIGVAELYVHQSQAEEAKTLIQMQETSEQPEDLGNEQ